MCIVFSVERYRDLNLPSGWSREFNDLAGPNGTEHLLLIPCSVGFNSIVGAETWNQRKLFCSRRKRCAAFF